MLSVVKEQLELSIIVPVFNEGGGVGDLLRMLARQEEVAFEILLVDGGSTDGSPEIAWKIAREMGLPLRILKTERGRARQMNAGVGTARGEWILFLHADSAFTCPHALKSALALLKKEVALSSGIPVLGHFALRFDQTGEPFWFGYAFCEAKARLNRPGCTLGDQGFLLAKRFFEAVGPFDESLPVGEDVIWAEQVRRSGRIILISAEIVTSPRRFRTEGFLQRQTLNAMIMACLFTGNAALLAALPAVYCAQSDSGRLVLRPYFRAFQLQLDAMPRARARKFWRGIGGYVRDNAWQLALLADSAYTMWKGDPPGSGRMPILEFFDRWGYRLLQGGVGRVVATFLVRGWFTVAAQDIRKYGHKKMGC